MILKEIEEGSSWMADLTIYHNLINFLSLIGQDKGYTVKYSPSSEGIPEGTPNGKELYLTIYSELSPN